MNTKILDYIKTFDEETNDRFFAIELFMLAETYFDEGEDKKALAMVCAMIQMEIPEESKLQCFKLAYKVFFKNNLHKQANSYYDAAVAVDMRDEELLDDRALFYDIPKLYGYGAKMQPYSFFGKEGVRIQEPTVDNLDLNAFYMFVEEGYRICNYALEIAYLTGRSNNKDLVYLSEGDNYLVSGRLLRRIGVPNGFIFLKDEAEKLGQVMQCHQSLVKHEKL